METINTYGWYMKGALACLRALIGYGMIKDNVAPLEVGKKYSEAKETEFIDAAIIKKCLSDRQFLEKFLLQDEICFEWSIDGKYKKVSVH